MSDMNEMRFPANLSRRPIAFLDMFSLHGVPVWIRRADGWSGWGIVEVSRERPVFRTVNPDIGVLESNLYQSPGTGGQGSWEAFLPQKTRGGSPS